jgi:DNA-binding LacI/PurR family transcriptional regulator
MATETQTRSRRAPTVTIEDVARLAGVSRATASRVANESPHVSPSARIRVKHAIDQLGYVPNRAARSLMTRRSDSIGVVIPEPAALLFADPFFGRLLLGISAGLADRDVQLVLLIAPTQRDETRVERYLDSGHVDGAIVLSYVDADNLTGAKLAVRHLVDQGRRSIATIHGSLDLSAARDRVDGYRAALREAGLPVEAALEADGHFTSSGAAGAMRTLLTRRPGLDAVFAASDSMAAAAVGVLQDAGRRIPEDVAVVGFDDTSAALATRPQLTTVRQPIEAMGQEMARLLLRRIADPEDAPSHVVFATELVVRGSSVGE